LDYSSADVSFIRSCVGSKEGKELAQTSAKSARFSHESGREPTQETRNIKKFMEFHLRAEVLKDQRRKLERTLRTLLLSEKKKNLERFSLNNFQKPFKTP